MKILRKMLSVVMVVVVTVALVFPAEATTYDVKESISLYFLSKDVPDDAEDYGRLYFSRFSTEELFDLGFTFEEMLDLRLAPAIMAYEYDPCDNPYYYFPVLSGGRVIAMLTMTDMGNGMYSVQFGKSRFAESLNELDTDKDNPNILVIAENGMFALDTDNNFTLIDSYNILSEISSYSRSYDDTPDVTFELASLDTNRNVLVNSMTTYDECVNLNSSRTILRNFLNVPIVPNGSNASCAAANPFGRA